MKQCLRLSVALAAAAITGCSTGPYLRPDAVSGVYSTVNPTCPGAKEVVAFSPEKQPWVLLRIYATPPKRWGSEGTELRVHFFFHYLAGESAFIFYFTEEQRKLIRERSSKDYLVTASKPTVTVVLPDGSSKEVRIPIFGKPYDPKHDRTSWWANGVQISSENLDSFTVIFPDIYVNGEKINVPPIYFKKEEGRYAPVLNC